MRWSHPARLLTAWYARVFLRSLRHLDPRTVHRVNGVYVPGGRGERAGLGGAGDVAGAGDEIRLVVVGDSTALGIGVGEARQAPGAVLGQWLAEETGRAVRVWVYGRFGATTPSLAGKVEQAVSVRPDLVVLLTGANDSLLPVPLGRAARALGRHVRRLVGEGAAVVAAVSPDAGCGGAIPGFLGRLLSLRCRRLGRLQARHALRAGARVVSFRDDGFRTHRSRLIAGDGFHPSAAGYELHGGRLMHAMLASLANPGLPAVHAALCLRRTGSLRPTARRVARTPDSHAAPTASSGEYEVQVLPPKRRRGSVPGQAEGRGSVSGQAEGRARARTEA
ncbi:GDSL-type esterase/lipase family protein [Streptomyces niveiscabiei]|uniref:GDSL-type esterase/lipase family protein n=1 Tax=Streptomyces niveiscabiei TaxID=164115 RepID=UPI0029A29AD3|nr:GDSL-type esterase/lipase family protein [Streptomyces niveiscabiei]MDX3382342.1 GDSL-type esterase/lipase family protein [Streptomyces niveiscabiei]